MLVPRSHKRQLEPLRVWMDNLAAVQDAKDQRLQDGHKDHYIFGDGQDPSADLRRSDSDLDHGCQDRAIDLDCESDRTALPIGTEL